MPLSSVWDNSFDEINDALISPLFCEQSLKKLSIILFTKKILLFSIKSKKDDKGTLVSISLPKYA